MNLLRATLAVLFALAFAVPSQAAPPDVAASSSRLRTKPQPQALFVTGLHANQVEPIVRGIAVETASVAVYTTCFLALASESTCVDIASKARTSLSR